MADTSLNTREIDELFQRVRDLVGGPETARFLEYVGDRVGVLGESYAREYPERREGVPLPKIYTLNGKPSKFKSRRQQGFVMSLAAKGKIPGKRTGFLGNSITHAVTVVDTGVIVSIGTNLAGAKYALGDETEQNHYLASLGWVPLANKEKAHVDDFRQEIVLTSQGYLAGYIKGDKR